MANKNESIDNMNNFREALRAAYGDEIADNSEIGYSNAWYYVKQAKKFEDGSVGCTGHATAYRRQHLLYITEKLLKQAKDKS